MKKLDEFRRVFGAARALIFDFDGVLADSEKWHFATYAEVFARHGHTIDETEYYRYWTSLGQGAEGEIARHGLDLDPATVRDEKRPIFSERCRDGSITLYPQVHEILERLSRSGKTLSIASGTPAADIEAILENSGERGRFSAIVGSDTVPAIKPAPDLFLAMLGRLGREPGECLVIEDAEKGMEAAIAAGIPVVVVRTGETRRFDFGRADLVLDSHDEFLRLVRETFPA